MSSPTVEVERVQAGSKVHADNLSRRVSARKRIPRPLTLRRLALNCLIDLQGGAQARFDAWRVLGHAGGPPKQKSMPVAKRPVSTGCNFKHYLHPLQD